MHILGFDDLAELTWDMKDDVTVKVYKEKRSWVAEYKLSARLKKFIDDNDELYLDHITKFKSSSLDTAIKDMTRSLVDVVGQASAWAEDATGTLAKRLGRYRLEWEQ